MSIDRIIYCEGPGCGATDSGGLPTHIQTAEPAPYLPPCFLEVREGGHNGSDEHHFCSWDCLMKFAAKFPPPERIEFPEAA